MSIEKNTEAYLCFNAPGEIEILRSLRKKFCEYCLRAVYSKSTPRYTNNNFIES